MKCCFLSSRGVLAVSGSQAEPFLQGLISQNISRNGEGRLSYGALLTPQGKIIADFLIQNGQKAFYLICDKRLITPLLKRLTLYRLRADVTLEDRSDSVVVAAAWGGSEGPSGWCEDPRLAALGWVALGSSETLQKQMPVSDMHNEADYLRHTAMLGVPIMGVDFETEQTFPMDVNMDRLHGVDFTKGCFVGQEVVSRMYRTGTVRKRTYLIKGTDLPAKGQIKAGDGVMGEMMSSRGDIGLCKARLDRLEKTTEENFTCDGKPVTLEEPDYLKGNA